MRYGMIDKPACEFHVFFGRYALRPTMCGPSCAAGMFTQTCGNLFRRQAHPTKVRQLDNF